MTADVTISESDLRDLAGELSRGTMVRRSRERLILLVEDDPGCAAAVEAMLVRREYRVDRAATLAEARRKIAVPRAYAAAIVDLELPDGSGEALVPELLAPGVACRPVILSGFVQGPRALGLVRQGATEVLQKPPDSFDLLSVLAQTVEVNVRLRRLLDGELPPWAIARDGGEAPTVAASSRSFRRTLRAFARTRDVSDEELKVLEAWVFGVPRKEIEARCGLSNDQVKRRIRSLSRKLGVGSANELRRVLLQQIEAER